MKGKVIILVTHKLDNQKVADRYSDLSSGQYAELTVDV